MYGFAGSTVVFGFNAFSYLVSFGFVFATRPRTAERAESVGTLREIWAGIRYVTEIPWLWVTITLFAFVLMFQWAPIQVLTPKLVRNHFHLGVGAYGVIFSMLGAGMIIGAITFGQMNPQAAPRADLVPDLDGEQPARRRVRALALVLRSPWWSRSSAASASATASPSGRRC